MRLDRPYRWCEVTRPGATQAAILVVAALVMLGVHKSDQDTQAQLNATSQKTSAITYNLCVARNKGVEAGNARWTRLARFMQEASTVPANARYQREWEAFAASIRPQPTAQCGDAP